MSKRIAIITRWHGRRSGLRPGDHGRSAHADDWRVAIFGYAYWVRLEVQGGDMRFGSLPTVLARRRTAITLLVAAIAIAFTLRPPAVAETNPRQDDLFGARAEAGDADAQYRLGELLVRTGAISMAADQYLKAALQGHVEARTQLGVYHYIEKNYAEALKWLRLAAEAGNAKAQGHVGTMYAHGEGLPRNHEESIKWYTRAAEQGHAVSAEMLGISYYTGVHTPQNYKEAERWFMKAANQGSAEAQYALSLMYLDPRVRLFDFEAAKRWHARAAAKGHARAQLELARDFERRGDCFEAHMWAHLAATSLKKADDRAEAVRLRSECEAKMPPERVVQAQIQASRWIPTKEKPAK